MTEQQLIESDSQAGEPATPPSDDDGGAGKKTLDVRRWVQLGYVSLFLLLAWVLQHAVSSVWYNFGDPSPTAVTLVAMLLSALATAACVKHPGANQLANEVAEELSKVTWPTRAETSSSTVVVIITSIIAAAFLGVCDAVWSALTDKIY